MGTELRFDDRVAIVTGAGRGLGRAYAHALAARGARVVVNDLGASLFGTGSDPGPADAVAQEIRDAGGQAIASAATVTTSEGAEAITASALDAWGRIDVVVNNAGNLEPGALPDVTAEEIARHLDIHVLGSFNVSRAAWPHLVERAYGRVVVTTSVGMYGAAAMIGYSTAKGACASLGRALAAAGAPEGIRVNLISPAAETRMITDPAFRAKVELPELPAGAEPDPQRGPENVTPMLLVLAHESCPVNGQTLFAGLGRFARIFWAETPGIVERGVTAESLLERWDEVVDPSEFFIPATTPDAVRYREELLASRLGDA